MIFINHGLGMHTDHTLQLRLSLSLFAEWQFRT